MKPNMCRAGARKGKIKLKKRLLSILLATVMVLSAVPLGLGLVDTAYAAETANSGTCGDNVTWRLSDDGVLTISGTGDMADFEWDGTPWCSVSSQVKSVVIKDGVTSIGDCAFGGCISLTSVSIPDGVISIGFAAFESCSLLTGVTIPNSVTGIGDYAFGYCSSLISVTIPGSVTSIGEAAFAGGSTSVNVSRENKNYCSVDGGLYDKQKTTIFHPGKIQNGAFRVPDGVTSIGDAAFAGSTTSINVSRENKNYCSVDGGLYNKQKTTILHPGKIQNGTFRIPDGVTSIGDYAFDGYRSLTNVTIPDSVTNICYGAFLDCIKLTDVYYDGTASDWAKITIEEGNEPLTNATLHCAKSAPTAPVVRIGNSASSGKPMLTWNAVEGATSYRIYRSTSKGSGYSLLGTVTATSYTNTGAKAGTTYYYRVKACNDAGMSPYSNIVSGQVKSVTPKLSAPVVKIGNSAASGKPMLTWNAVSGATSYKVYRATSQNGTYSLLGTVTATSYTNTGAKAGVTYYYKVKAVNSAGESAYSNIVSGRATVTTLTMGHSGTSGKPQLTWKAVSGAASYKVYRANSKNGAYSVINTTKALTYTNTGAALGTTYYYKVEALNAAGKSMGFSAVVEGKVAPVLAVGYSSVSGKPQLTWKAVPGATEYQVYRSTQQNSGYSKINTTTSTSYVNTGAKAGTTYYYKIVAVKGTAVSDFSNIVSARPGK